MSQIGTAFQAKGKVWANNTEFNTRVLRVNVSYIISRHLFQKMGRVN